MLPRDSFNTYVEKMAQLEEEEPVLCAWRTQAGQIPDERLRILRAAVRRARLLVRFPIPCRKPKRGQAVVLLAAATPATLGTIRPIATEFNRRGKPVFLITTRASRSILKDGLHDGHADLTHLLARIPPNERWRLRRVVGEISEKVHQLLEPYPDGGAKTWIAQGLQARVAAQQLLGGAGVVIADCDIEPWRKGFILGANSLGIPTVILQHGLFGPYHFPVHASHLFTWGPYFCADASKYDLREITCEPWGCPRWDHLAALRSAPRDLQLFVRLRLNSERPVVLLISNAHGAENYRHQYDAFYRGVSKLLKAGLQVAIKLHPAERDLQPYRDRIARDLIDHLVVLPRDVDIETALRCADTVYHVFSAAALESMALGVPTLFERGLPGDKLCDYPDLGGGEWASPNNVLDRSRVLLSDQVERRLLVEKQDRFLGVALASMGEATQRVVDRLEELSA